MRNSLERLFEQFPDFLDKSETSNFRLSQSVTNDELRKIRQSVADTIESFHLDKRLWVWKEQSKYYDYTINFRADYPYIESVTLMKNDTVIYSERYGYEQEVHSFNYSYTDSTLNDGSYEEAPVIPEDTFTIIITTHNEIEVKKGFPENDTIQGNEFDHDESLDEIGALHNIPRKTYLTDIPITMYDTTEPPYNDRATEDDYHYMQRMLEYTLRMHTDYPVVLEIWKLYGIESTVENRERLLVKMFDEKYHNGLDWNPQVWEHKDRFCNYTTDNGVYFFVSPSTKTPLKNKPVTLYFKLKNSFAEDIDQDYLVDIYLNNTLLETDYPDKSYKLSNIPVDIDNICTINCKNTTGGSLGTDNITISVRGCNNADYYVNTSGDDSNPGTRTSQFKTLQRAVNATQNDISVIAVQNGNFNISTYDPVIVKNTCTFVGCGSVLIENEDSNLFFTIPSKKGLTLNDMTFQFEGSITDVDDVTVKNMNYDNTPVEVLVFDTGEPAVELTRISMNVETSVLLGDTITVTGALTDKYDEGVEGKTVRVTCPGATPVNATTDSNGEFTADLDITRTGSLTVTAKFAGDSSYAPVRITTDIISKISIEDAFEDYDYVVMDMEYGDNDWDYTYLAVSEIESLSDVNGAVMNLKFTDDKNVQFNRFQSTSTDTGITQSELRSLTGMLMGIIYDDYKVKHTDYEVN